MRVSLYLVCEIAKGFAQRRQRRSACRPGIARHRFLNVSKISLRDATKKPGNPTVIEHVRTAVAVLLNPDPKRVVKWGDLLLAPICFLLVLVGSPLAVAAPFNAHPMTIPFAQPDGSMLQLSSLTLSPQKRGRFPLAVVSHGSPRSVDDLPRMAPEDLLNVGKWLVDRGYAVVIPMRRGYGHSQGVFAEGYGFCQSPNYVRGGRASAQDIEAVTRFMQGQSFVDASHVVLIGHSAGAWGSIAAASEPPRAWLRPSPLHRVAAR
jgi:alpha/beta superfamily hydrolase